MAKEDDDRKPSWSSWFAPGDVRQAPDHEHDKRPTAVASPNQAQDTPQSESNPLITFKHFVDDTFSALTSSNKKLEDVLKAREDEFDKMYKMWTGAENTRHLVQIQDAWVTRTKADCESMGDPSDEARATARMILLESARRNSHVSPSKITALFEDPAAVRSGGDEYPPWLSVDWFRSSKDSPINLEADPALAKYDTKWRHAFEDLLEAALDKPISSRERIGYRGSIGPNSTWRGPGLDWMLSLQCRGILPPQLPTMYSNASVASEFFADVGMSHTVLGRWCQQHCRTSESNLWDNLQIDYEYDQLLTAIDTPAPEDTTFVYRKLEALGIPCQPATGGGAIGMNENESLARQRTAQHATTQESVSKGDCPDELGRAVSEATKSSHEPDTELDIYEQMYNDWLEDSEDQSNESDSFGARCPDELGRAVGEAARQEAARAFADEENGLGEYDAESMAAGALGGSESDKHHALRDYQMQTKLPEQQNKKRLAIARAEALANEQDDLRRAERQQLPQELDASARGSALTELEETTALNGLAPSKSDVARAEGRGIERLRTLQRVQDSVNVDHKLYIEVLAAELQALRDEHEELAEDFADALERLENESRILEQKDPQPPFAHPQKPAPAHADTNRPQVLSTLTTTETTRLPDGSVKTTVVLKRRFAGGFEETQESTQTSFEDPTAAPSSNGQDLSKKGWFWS